MGTTKTGFVIGHEWLVSRKLVLHASKSRFQRGESFCIATMAIFGVTMAFVSVREGDFPQKLISKGDKATCQHTDSF